MGESKYKKISFIHYIAMCDEDFFDFPDWLTSMEKKELTNEILSFEDFSCKIEACEFIKEFNYWICRFTKAREYNYPNIIKAKERPRSIDLKDDEYLGEDTFILYDVNLKKMIVQSNMYSLKKDNLEKIFTICNENEIVKLEPIIDRDVLNRLKEVRTIKLGINLFDSISYEDDSLSNIIREARDMGGKEIFLEINANETGNKNKNKLLDTEKVNEVKNFILRNNLSIRKGKADILTNKGFENTDLFNYIMKEEINVKLKPKQSISFIDMKDKLIKKYNERKNIQY